MEAKMKCILGWIFDGFLVDLIAFGNLPHRALGKLSNMVPKIFKKSTKNGVSHRPRKLKKNSQKWGTPSAQGASDGSWGLLGSPGRVLGVSWAVLDASWGRLGRFWAEQVANMAPTWVPKWNQNGPKIDPKIDQNFDGSRDRFLIEF